VKENFLEILAQKVQPSPFYRQLDAILIDNASMSSVERGNYWSGGFHFRQYKSLKEAYDDAAARSNSRIRYNYPTLSDFENFLNTPTPSTEKATEILDNVLTNTKEIVNLGGLIEKDKIIVTQDDRGLFDFSLASQGLFRPVEYYSESFVDFLKQGEKTNPFAFTRNPVGVIPDIKVNKKNKDYVFTFLGNDFECERRQRGTTNVYNKFPSKCFLKETPTKIVTTYQRKDVNKVFNGEGKTRLKYSSSNKKCYLIYNQKDASAKYVDFYLPQNFYNSNLGFSMVSVLPSLIAASMLEEFGIKTRISTMRIGTEYLSGRNRHTFAASIPIKDYEQSTKDVFTKLLNLQANWQITASFFADLKNNIEEREGNGHNGGQSFSRIGYWNYPYMINVLERYKNYLSLNPELDETKVISNNFMIADALNDGMISYTGSTTDEIKSSKIFYDNIPYIFFKIYFLMDFIAIEINTMQNFVAELEKRFSENKYFKDIFTFSSKDEKKQEIRRYIINILHTKYAIVSGSANSYPDTKEQDEEKASKFAEKLKELNEVMKTR
tara:strand:+ start:1700 stop:3352 length:1653 start_codon:yes stop_codon:yes gene_type:complete